MKIKDADESDLMDVFVWRNDPVSCQMSFGGNKVTAAEHKIWFQNSLVNKLRKIYIGMLGSEKVGVCRFDRSSIMNSSEVSINLNPIMRGRNISFALLSGAIETYKKNNLVELHAKIKKENVVSLKIFQKCKFSVVHEDDACYYLIQN